MDKPMSVEELAQFLGVSKSWVQKQCAARTIPFSRVGRQIRFTEEHARQILSAGEHAPVAASNVTSIHLRRTA